MRIKSFASKLFKRVSLTAISAVLSISSLSAAMPLFLSQTVHAVGGITDATTNMSYPTIQAAINGANPNDTINVATGEYPETGQIVINKNLSIVGADKLTTIIKPTQDTGLAPHDDSTAWIKINSGVTFNLSNVTLDGTGRKINYGIFSHGHGTINNIVMTHIQYNQSADYAGTGIELYGSNMTLSNNSFNNIGREGMYVGNGSVATITGNTYTGKGIGNWLDYAFEVGRNGQAEISSNRVSDNLGMTSNGAWGSAGILVSSYYNPSTPSRATITGNTVSSTTNGIDLDSGATATISSNTISHSTTNAIYLYATSGNSITNNTISTTNQSSGTLDVNAGAAAWGIAFDGGSNNNTVTGNDITTSDVAIENWNGSGNVVTGNKIHGNYFGVHNNTSNVINATNNWWGSASGPGSVGPGTGDKVSTNVNFDPWCTNSTCTTVSSPNAITVPATGITLTDATLNGTNGSYGATGHSLWVSTAPFSTNSSTIPSGVYSTPVLGPVAANGNFSTLLSSLTTDAVVTGGVHSAMPAITTNTTYYYAAWSEVNNVWYPGQVLSFTTARFTAPTNLTLKTSPGNATIAPNGSTNSYGVTVSWSPVAGANHYAYKTWDDISGSSYDAAHPYPVNTSATTLSGSFNQGEGVYHVSVSACDAANNCSDANTSTVTYDHTLPAKPVITAPGARTWYKTTPIVDKWSPVTGDLSGINHYQIAYHYDDGHSFGGSTCPGVTILGYTGFIGCRDVVGTERDHTPGANEQGGVTIWVRAIDNAGNVGPWSSSVNYHYDFTAATTTINISPLHSGVTGNEFTVSGDANDNLALNRVYVQLINKSTGARYGGTTINLIPNGKTGHWAHDYNASSIGLPDGNYYAVAEATDMAGNSTATPSLAFTVDHTAPSVTINALALTKNNEPTFTGTVNDPTATVILNIDGIDHKATNINGIWTYVVTSPLSDSSHALSATATDTIGNTTTPSVTSIVLVDTTAPIVTIASPTSGAYGFVKMVNIKANIDDATSYSIYVNGSDVHDGTGAYVPYALAVNDGTYNTYKIYVEATDAAGNTGTSATTTIIVDNTKPTLTVPTYIGTSLTPTISGTTNGSTVTVDSIAATVNTDGTWIYTLPTQTIGTHIITITSTDKYGNNTTQLATVVVNAVPATQTTPATTTTTITPTGTTTTNTGGQAVLGDSTTTPNNTSANKTSTPSVLGVSTNKTPTSTPWSLAWYWWLLIVAAIIALLWWIIAAIRQRQPE